MIERFFFIKGFMNAKNSQVVLTPLVLDEALSTILSLLLVLKGIFFHVLINKHNPIESLFSWERTKDTNKR